MSGEVKGLIPRRILRCCVVFKAEGGRLGEYLKKSPNLQNSKSPSNESNIN